MQCQNRNRFFSASQNHLLQHKTTRTEHLKKGSQTASCHKTKARYLFALGNTVYRSIPHHVCHSHCRTRWSWSWCRCHSCLYVGCLGCRICHQAAKTPKKSCVPNEFRQLEPMACRERHSEKMANTCFRDNPSRVLLENLSSFERTVAMPMVCLLENPRNMPLPSRFPAMINPSNVRLATTRPLRNRELQEVDCGVV
jgi:hypothetical protein